MRYRDECTCECHQPGSHVMHFMPCCYERPKQVYKAPEKYPIPDPFVTIFLDGSIEMGAAENWQALVENYFKRDQITFYNPRRDNWDSSWEQSIDNPAFKEQVTWELDAIDKADYVLMYFDPNTKSPITLLELGLIAAHDPDKLIVACPDGFWRKGNVDIVCKRFGIGVAKNLQEAIVQIQSRLPHWKMVKIRERGI